MGTKFWCKVIEKEMWNVIVAFDIRDGKMLVLRKSIIILCSCQVRHALTRDELRCGRPPHRFTEGVNLLKRCVPRHCAFVLSHCM
jgi:hypothetical protein